MTEAMKSGALTNPRIKGENLNQRAEENVLQFQVFAAVFPLSVPAVPRVAKRVPPHVDRCVERLIEEETLK